MSFLPISKQDMDNLGIEQLDFIYVSGDAYVDHPSFGHAIITRLVESQGFSIGIIAQPTSEKDYLKLGTPKFAFFVGSGVVDSMVNNFTVAKKRRTTDVYSNGGKAGKRPDRALSVYCKNLRKLFGDVPIIVGGIEASLRRFAHYDYWANKVLPSILLDTDADLLMFGMGELATLELLKYAKRNVPLKHITNIDGTCYKSTYENLPKKFKEEMQDTKIVEIMPSFEQVKNNKLDYIKAFQTQIKNTDSRNSRKLVQQVGDCYIVQNLPSRPMTEQELDFVYSLPFERTFHPVYTGGIPAIKEVEFSVNSHRGCFGNCAFCAITYHQGRVVQHRSKQSILSEVELLSHKPNFKGYIHDIGGPSANFFNTSCKVQQKCGICQNSQCIGKDKCPNLVVDHSDYLDILRSARAVKGVKKVFVRSGVRYDYVMYDSNPEFFKELCQYHISGQLKIAPEHICDNVLDFMNKPHSKLYLQFAKRYEEYNKKIDKKQFLVPYFISSHPSCTLENAIELACYLKKIHHIPEQVQDFYPTPSTLATTAFYTELNPINLQPIFVAKSNEEKAMQRALLQFSNPKNYDLVRQALTKANREDLIGFEEYCLIRPKSKSNKTFNYTNNSKPFSRNKKNKSNNFNSKFHKNHKH